MEVLRAEHLGKTYGQGDTKVEALRDVSFSVEKGEHDGRTYTRVDRLDRTGREDELARLMGGGAVSGALRQSACELLDRAEAYRKDRDKGQISP